MPAMKRPAAAPAARTLAPPKKAAKAPVRPPPPPTNIEKVAQAIWASEELPESCRAMMVEVLPHCVGQRLAIQFEMLSMVEQTLNSCAASAASRAEAAAATAAEAMQKHEEDKRAVDGADKAVSEALESCVPLQALHSSATDAYQAAQRADALSNEALAAHQQKLEQIGQEKSVFQEKVQAKFLALKTAPAFDEAETSNLIESCKSYDFDQAVLASVSCIYNKALETRTNFDELVLTQFEEEANKKVAGFVNELAQGECEHLRLEGEHKAASEATSAALDAQQARSVELDAAQERVKNATRVAADAAEAAQKSGNVAKAEAEKALVLKQQSDDYQAGPIAAFKAAFGGSEKEVVEAIKEVAEQETAEPHMDVVEAAEAIEA